MAAFSFDLVLLVIYFAYGLAFFGMGLTLALELQRSPALAESRLLRFLAAFGMLHGAYEWLDLYLLQPVNEGMLLPAWLLWFRLVMMSVSFFFLALYGVFTLRLRTRQKGSSTRIIWLVLFLYGVGMVAVATLTYRPGYNTAGEYY